MFGKQAVAFQDSMFPPPTIPNEWQEGCLLLLLPSSTSLAGMRRIYYLSVILKPGIALDEDAMHRRHLRGRNDEGESLDVMHRRRRRGSDDEAESLDDMLKSVPEHEAAQEDDTNENVVVDASTVRAPSGMITRQAFVRVFF